MSISGVPLQTITSYLDSLLNLAEVPDEPNAVNGLQVSNRGEVHRLFAAVDASQDTIDAAAEAGSRTLILVHHGLFWDGNAPVTGRRYRRLRALFEHDLALYSAHIALDVHPELGNNVALAGRIGLTVRGWFGRYKGVALGVWGDLELPRESLLKLLETELAVSCKLIPGGPERTARVGIISGAGGNMVGQAIQAGLDTYITGEGPHHTYFDATEGGANLIYAGHYATEQLGVQRLAQHLSERFGIPWEYHYRDTGL
jgi:dinuclear metal center YbgI/SA1388 family protein